MDSFQAAVLLEKMDIFDDELAARHRVAGTYNERLSHIAKPQAHVGGALSGYGYYAMRIENRDHVVSTVKEMGVPTAVYYSTPLHQMEAYEAYAPEGGLPVTEQVSADILSLPMHPYLTPDQVDYICDAVESASRK